ncbi:urea hydro-lyase cyanamide [Thozetella sp. PMI_491]|nr:urea hydro-lyase cyanamide [Thozetella sp. PMI_491]
MAPVDATSSVAVHGWSAVPVDPNAIFLGKPYLNKPEPLLVDDIVFPANDPVAAKVQQYAKEKLAPETFNHSMRVFYFASAILRQQFPQQAETLSSSTLALTCLLHDIGTTDENLHATQLSFEFYGGLLALDLIGKQLGAPQSQAEAVCEAIIRHQDLGTVGTITFLGQLIQLATIYDNVGGMPEIIHNDTRVAVNKAFSREGWSQCFAHTIGKENGLKPWAHTTHLGTEAFPNQVLGNPLAELP